MTGGPAPEPIALTALYVPGDRPERFDKAAGSGADIVLLDLEDAVHPTAKPAARAAVVEWLARRAADGRVTPAVQVRISPPETPWFADDIAELGAAVGTGVGIRLAKTQGPGEVEAVTRALDPGVEVHALIETALGVERAYEIAAHPAVASLGLGEADLASELRTGSDAALDWPRSRIIVAAAAAGLPAPMMAVYPPFTDDAGLSASCRLGQQLGFVGRTAIHPRQLPIIVEAFRPPPDEVTRAQAVLDALAGAETTGDGIAVLVGGEMLDRAMLGSAREVLAREAAATAALATMGR